jgi:short-subunit dehydrogenase
MSQTSTVALVTGASSGIGRDLACLLAADRCTLVLSARGVEALEALAAQLRTDHGITVYVIPADLADPLSPQRLADELAELNLNIDILINNAGFGSHGLFATADMGQQLSMVQVNINALVHLTRLLLPGMIARGRGRIMNVASVAAFVPGPLMAVYYASKAFVLSFSEALSAETRGSGVSVTALCPGVTDTDFHRRAKIGDTRLYNVHTMSSIAVAKIGYRAMMRRQRVAITGLRNKLLVCLIRFVPNALILRATKRLNESRHDGPP